MALDTGLMAFWADFEDADIQALREWHNCEHMSERVNIPGFRLGRRYRGIGAAATFLMYYETERPEVLASDPYHAALNAPTDWTRRMLATFRNPARAVFGLVDECGIAPAEPAFYLATMRFNAKGGAQAMRAAYRDRVLPELAARDGTLRARLWENRETISGMKTRESGIYGDGPGRQQFVLFVETLTRQEPPDPATLPGLTGAERAAHIDAIPEIGWLDFALR